MCGTLQGSANLIISLIESESKSNFVIWERCGCKIQYIPLLLNLFYFIGNNTVTLQNQFNIPGEI